VTLKAIVITVVAILLIVGGWYGYHAAYKAGAGAGAAHIQVLWDADKAQIQAVTDKALAEANAAHDQAVTNNEAITDAYEAQLTSADALSDDLAHRLRDAEARAAANRGAVSKAGSGPGVVGPAPPSGPGQLERSLAAALTECRANSDQLAALIAELRPQL